MGIVCVLGEINVAWARPWATQAGRQAWCLKRSVASLCCCAFPLWSTVTVYISRVGSRIHRC